MIDSLLLIFGLQWLRKAILHASGYKALHDEDLIFSEDLAIVVILSLSAGSGCR